MTTEYQALLVLARQHLQQSGTVEIGRESLHAHWLSDGWATRLAGDLGAFWSRDDKNGRMIFMGDGLKASQS